MKDRPSTAKSFFRYIIASFLATGVDFLVLISLTEVLNFWYLLSATIGAISGGIVGFLLGRNWAFMSKSANQSEQAFKYSFVWIGSIALNVGLLYIFVEYFEIQYILSKIMVAIIVGVGFNYLLQKNFIFK